MFLMLVVSAGGFYYTKLVAQNLAHSATLPSLRANPHLADSRADVDLSDMAAGGTYGVGEYMPWGGAFTGAGSYELASGSVVYRISMPRSFQSVMNLLSNQSPTITYIKGTSGSSYSPFISCDRASGCD
jgi:hypothetical protein